MKRGEMEKTVKKEGKEIKIGPFLIPNAEKNGAILESIKSYVGVVDKLESIKSYVGLVDKVAEQVDKIINWINQEERKLAEKEDHKAFLSLDFNYSDKLKRTAVDAVLRLLGTRLLTDEERADISRPPSTGLQATNRPNLFIYYEHTRPEGETHIQEKYTLFVSKKMKLPSVITPEKIEEVKVEEPIPKEVAVPPEALVEELPPPEIVEEKIKEGKEEKKPPGIFETINKVLLGEDEEY